MKKKISLELSTKQLEFAVVTDCHLSIESGSKEFGDFIGFLNSLTKLTDHIILSGDMFQVWAGNTLMDHKNGRDLLATIQCLSDQASFYFLEGNWDFFICRNFTHYFKTCCERDLRFQSGDVEIVIVHGHLWTTFKDRLLIYLLKNSLSYKLFSTGLFNRLLNRLNSIFQKKLYSKQIPEKILSDIAERLRKEFSTYNYILCGHFHQKFQSHNVYFMPDYGKSGSFIGFKNGLKIYRLEDDRLCEEK